MACSISEGSAVSSAAIASKARSTTNGRLVSRGSMWRPEDLANAKTARTVHGVRRHAVRYRWRGAAPVGPVARADELEGDDRYRTALLGDSAARTEWHDLSRLGQRYRRAANRVDGAHMNDMSCTETNARARLLRQLQAALDRGGNLLS